MSSGEQVKLCTWADLSLADTQELIKCSQNRDDLKQALCKKLRLEIECAEDISTCKLKQNLIEADLFTYAFLFGLEEKYSPAQLSTLITIIKNVHALCVSSMFDNHSDALSYFQKLVIQHSVSRPPFSVQIFNPNEVKNLNEYVLSTYFKHYKLYKYAFTRRVHLNISLAYTGEEPEIKTENKETDVSAQGSTSEQEDRESMFLSFLCTYITNHNYLL